MTYEEKRNSALYERKNIEYIFIERLRPSVYIDDKFHRVLSILGRGWYLYNDDIDTFLLMFGTHYTDKLIDFWVINYGVSLGVSPNLFKSLAKKHWHKHLYNRTDFKHKLKILINKQKTTPKSSTKYLNIEFLIEETLASMLEAQFSIINKQTIFDYRKKASFSLQLDILPRIKGYSRLCKYGRYSSANKDGMTLDHRLSIKVGFDNDIPPYILAHPANCEFLSLKENSSKNKKCSISYEQLIKAIDTWDSQLVTVC